MVILQSCTKPSMFAKAIISSSIALLKQKYNIWFIKFLQQMSATNFDLYGNTFQMIKRDAYTKSWTMLTHTLNLPLNSKNIADHYSYCQLKGRWKKIHNACVITPMESTCFVSNTNIKVSLLLHTSSPGIQMAATDSTGRIYGRQVMPLTHHKQVQYQSHKHQLTGLQLCEYTANASWHGE